MDPHLLEIWEKSDLFGKAWRHQGSLKSYKLLLLLHCVKQNPH